MFVATPGRPNAVAHAAPVLFVAGPGANVRFRIDLRDGTLSTPTIPKLLEDVVEVDVAERLLFVCQDSNPASARAIVGFDLKTGVQIRDVEMAARTASLDATFCTHAPQRHNPHPRVSTRLQNI